MERPKRDWNIDGSAEALNAVVSRSYEDDIETVTLRLCSIPALRPGDVDVPPLDASAYPKIALTVCPVRASVELTCSGVVLGIASVSRIRNFRDRVVIEADSGILYCRLTLTREGLFTLKGTPYSVDSLPLLDLPETKEP